MHQPILKIQNADYLQISASESNSNPDTDIIFHIHQYLYSYLYLKVRCGYIYDEDNIRSLSEPISECWVLDNDICMEDTILQWNEAIDFDNLSW